MVKLSVLNCIPSLTCSLHWRLQCTCRIITFLKHEIMYGAISLFGILPTAICSKLTPPSSDKDILAATRGNLSRPKKRWSGWSDQISIKIGHPTKLERSRVSPLLKLGELLLPWGIHLTAHWVWFHIKCLIR